MNEIYKIRLKKGDKVVVRSGKYKGQQGVISSVQPKDNTVIIEGINIVKKHQKPSKQHPQGGIIEVQKPIPVSKVGIYEPTTKKAARVAYKIDKEGNKTRIYSSTKKEIK